VLISKEEKQVKAVCQDGRLALRGIRIPKVGCEHKYMHGSLFVTTLSCYSLDHDKQYIIKGLYDSGTVTLLILRKNDNTSDNS
jgi:hypothetical protein